MTVPWEIHYDRRLDAAFLAWFTRGGTAASLAEYVRYARFPLDLQFRKDPKTRAQHATLYTGLTAVLKVERVGDLARLRADPYWANEANRFDPTWGTARSAEDWKPLWPSVETYLETVIPIAHDQYGRKEGAIQAAVSVFASGSAAMLDREVVMAFRDAPTRQAVMAQLTDSLVQVCASVPGVKGKPKGKFGGELDVLAVDKAGRLLAIEVKPDNVPTITWAGAQAEAYARLLRYWMSSPALPDVPAPVEVLQGMLSQRQQVKLASSSAPTITASMPVVPVVAVPRGTNPALLASLTKVQDHLQAKGQHDVPVEIYEVGLTGRMTRLR